MARAVVRFELNGQPVEAPCPDERVLLDLLRDDLYLTGSKRGCDLGTCGCCTVLLDGRPTLSCLTLARLVEGRKVTSIEGIAPPGGLHPVQRAFVEHGFVMTAVALLRDKPDANRAEVIEAISGNLCRCTGYTKIVEAILAAREG